MTWPQVNSVVVLHARAVAVLWLLIRAITTVLEAVAQPARGEALALPGAGELIGHAKVVVESKSRGIGTESQEQGQFNLHSSYESNHHLDGKLIVENKIKVKIK